MRFIAICIVLLMFGLTPVHAENDIIVVSAEGLADGNFYKDRRVAYDEAVKDAKQQILDKAVGAFIDSETLVKNYQAIADTIHTKYQGYIKRVLKSVDGGVEPDGFYHVWLKAEVSTKPLGESVRKFVRHDRQSLIRQHGNPTFATNIQVKPAGGERGETFRCDVCETEITGRLAEFGYRLVEWQGVDRDLQNKRDIIRLEKGELEAARYGYAKKSADVMISGQVKLKHNPIITLAGMVVQTVSLTNWTVKGVASHSSEIVFSQNFRPRNKVFNDEDEAIAAVGGLIGKLVSEEMLSRYVASPVKTILFEIDGLDDRRIAKDLKRDLLSARSILNVRFKEYLRNAEAVFEVDYTGSVDEFTNYLEAELLTGLNNKYGDGVFKVDQVRGDRVVLKVLKASSVDSVSVRTNPSLSILSGPIARAKSVIKTAATLKQVSQYNDNLPKSLDEF